MGRAGDHGHGPAGLRRLLDLGRLRRQELLRRARPAPRPDLALLLPLHRQQLRAGQPHLRDAALLELLAGAADPDLPARLPPHLLLLPQGLLPVLLAVAPGLRRGRRPRQLHRRDPVPPHPPEHPPLLLLDPPALQLRPHLRRHHRLPPARLRDRHQRRHGGPVRQRRLPVALLPVVPRLPALLRRAGALLRQAPDPPQALEVRHPAQRAPHALRLDQPLRRRLCDLYVRLVASGTIHDPGFHF